MPTQHRWYSSYHAVRQLFVALSMSSWTLSAAAPSEISGWKRAPFVGRRAQAHGLYSGRAGRLVADVAPALRRDLRTLQEFQERLHFSTPALSNGCRGRGSREVSVRGHWPSVTH